MKNSILVENKSGRTKEFRLLLQIETEEDRKYVVFTDDKKFVDGSLHTMVSVLNKKNEVLKSKPTIEEMKYIEKFLVSLCKEN